MKTKNEICVHIRNEKELQQAREILERNGERVDEEFFYLCKSKHFNNLYYPTEKDGWGLSIKSDGDIEIPLSELEAVLRGGSELHIYKHCGAETTQPDEECYIVTQSKKQSSIEWLVSILNKEGFAPVFTDEEIQKAKQMHYEEIIDSYTFGMYKGQEIYFSDDKIKLDINSANFCVWLSDDYYNEKFKND